jgi:hypothetical protein
MALFAGSCGLLVAVPAFTQNSQQFNLSATVDDCPTCDLQTQNLLAGEDDDHDSIDAGLDADVRSEDENHDLIDQSIEQHDTNAEDKQNALANEEERHQNALAAIQRQRAIEAARHEQRLAEIMAKAGKLLSDLISNAPGAPNGGSPQQAGNGGSAQPGAPQSAGNPPAEGAGVPPGSEAPPSGGGMASNPPAQANGGGGTQYPGGSPVGVPNGASPPASNGGGAPAGGGGTQYPGGSPAGVPNSAAPAQAGPSLPEKLGNFVKAAATRAINGFPNALQYFAATSRPAAQGLENQWTQPMSPQDAALMVGGAWMFESAGAGIGGAKGAFNQAVAGGASKPQALKAAIGTGTSFATNHAAALASAGTAGGSVMNGGLGGYNGQLATNGMPGNRGVLVNRSAGGNSGGGGGNPTANGGGPAPEEPGGGSPLNGYIATNFTPNIPPATQQALNDFNNGTLAGSVKSMTPQQFAGKTWQQAVQEIGQANGGWTPGETPGTYKSGPWTLSQKFEEPEFDEAGNKIPGSDITDLANPNKVPQIFITNNDGGVFRIKPLGVPGGQYSAMQQGHYALYAKVNPNAGLGWPDEAFKVVNGQAIPKTPFQIQPPAGISKWTPTGQQWVNANPNATSLPKGANPAEYYSPQFESWLQQTGWPNAGHQPMASSKWSPNALENLLGGGPNATAQ